MFRRLAVALMVSLVVSVNSGGTAEPTHDPLAVVQQAVHQNRAILLDVREKMEWDQGHLRDATLLPLSILEGGLSRETLQRLVPANKIVYCHCAYGSRSMTAADILRRQGYDVRPLQQGYDDLVRAGFQVAPR